MIVSLDNFQFPIPFKQIALPQQLLIQHLHDSRRQGTQLIGEAKLSDRQTVIILSYLLTALLQPQTHSHIQSQAPEDLRTIVYLCRNECRRQQLATIAQSVLNFLIRSLSLHPSGFSLQQTIAYNKVVLRICLGGSQQQRQHEQLAQYCKIQGFFLKRVYFLRVKQYLEGKLRRKEQTTWKKPFQFGCENDFYGQPAGYQSKRADYLLIETNDLEGLLSELLRVDLTEVHLHRAFIQFRKLNKYYNFRLEERKPKKDSSSKNGSRNHLDPPKKDIDLKKDQDLSFIQGRKNKEKKEKEIRTEEDGQQMDAEEALGLGGLAKKMSQLGVGVGLRGWNVGEYDRRFNQLYKLKKEGLIAGRVGYAGVGSGVAPEYEECYYLMNLQIAGYLLSFLIDQWKNNQFQQNHDSLNGFLNYLYSKTLLPTSYLRKLRRILLSFLRKHPPTLLNDTLSSLYLERVLYFFEKAVVWNDLFCKHDHPNPNPTDPTPTRFLVFRQKSNKDSNLKLLTFDQRILLELLTQSSKHFTILQNLALSFDYYENLFKPQKIRQVIVQYRCPKIVGEMSRWTVNGFIVSSTPNEEDLHLSSQRNQSNLEQLEDRKIDKDHYSQIIRAYGVLVHDLCELVPDGVVVYFPSATLLRECRAEWESKENIYQKINQIKRIYEEQEWQRENIFNVASYRKRCQVGRGAVYFISADSEFARHQTFFGPASNCVIFVGVPYHPYPLETDQKIKLLRLKETHHFQEALKNVCRCLSNCINSSEHVKTVVFADVAYNRTDLQKKWFPFIKQGNLNTLQVLEWVLGVNKGCSALVKRQKEEEQKRRIEEVNRKYEDKLDEMRRSASQMVQQMII